MHALKDFITTDYGLLSLAVIAITLGMGAWYVRFFLRHMEEDARRAAQSGR